MVNVMTDVVGEYHQVVMVSQYKSLSEYEKTSEEFMKNPSKDMKDAMKKMENLSDMYTTGGREIYKTW
jgi:hypothetical protein